jgi:hypothetical protein
LDASNLSVVSNIQCSLFRSARMFRTDNKTRSTEIVADSRDSLRAEM